MLQLFASFIFHYGVANLNKAVLEKSNKVIKFCGSKIENTHLKEKWPNVLSFEDMFRIYQYPLLFQGCLQNSGNICQWIEVTF